MSTVSKTTEAAADSAIFDGYTPVGGVFDELFDETGQVRPHGRRFVEELEAIGAAELSRRWNQAERHIRENGMVYSAYGEIEGAPRPWELDALPLVVPEDEWRTLSAGLVQRARLLDAVLVDLHGPQTLLQSGEIPAELVFSHPGFVRAFHGQVPPGGRYLHVYAVDLARAEDGRWWVVGDRTDAPMGMGYALENRVVVSGMLAGVIQRCQVQRLAPFFIALRDTLQQLSPTRRENPRIVLLSHGPGGPSYFEDSYLARYLGYTLVEGGDLTVRDDRVLMKTLGGLLPVDVILRRMSDQFGDPLELRGDPTLGVAGLLQAAREGHVAVANALGSSLVESPALMPFLPSVSRSLLGEELLLPSIATWWCGQDEARRTVLADLERLTLRSAYRVGRLEPAPIDQLRGRTAAELAAVVAAQPRTYAAQEQVARSCVPVWSKTGLQSRHVALRAFVVASGDSYMAMPGALVRVSGSSQRLDLSIIAGEGSKDAWVLSSQPVQPVTLLQPKGQSLQLRRGGSEFPSRVADNIFWLGRHIERAEGSARLLRPIVSRLASEAGADAVPELSALLHALAAQGQIEPGFVVEGIREQLPGIEKNLPSAVLDPSQPDSLRSTVAAMYRNASLVRDRMSIDSWRILHRVEEQIGTLAGRRRVDLADVLELLNTMILNLAAYGGLVGESMTRTQAWRFLDLGRRLERSLHTIALVRHTLVRPTEHEPAVLEAVLEVADSSMTYRSRYLANMQVLMVLDLLLTDETNPRSLAFQLVRLASDVDQLPREGTQPLLGPEQRITVAALDAVRLADLEALCVVARNGERTKLDRMLARLAEKLPQLSDLIAHKYLIHAEAPRQLAES